MGWDELRLLDALTYLEGFMAFVIFATLSWIGSPYGRYSSQFPGLQVPARPAWFLQELPSMAWPLYECARPAAARLGILPNRVLLAMFLIHYVQRFCLVVNWHGDKCPFRPHPEESEKTRGNWIQNTQGFSLCIHGRPGTRCVDRAGLELCPLLPCTITASCFCFLVSVACLCPNPTRGNPNNQEEKVRTPLPARRRGKMAAEPV
ncbi:3-oxo-5-alpha-steroid 4-dehydrogenase 1 isoform X3 [Peromyscus californicus insignis]|uniref:3-oxo-5-alpha-steroid 4-dehydrogenase 1 isoform X3 n=1 Tax=Peromyscus californicus insignis TaxID=564181 RepID=UPI0022A720E6|nr:3-oxo-5-alpha-steroid 4-dehydrogenase 1 isoform X3 [Peromyscus californicus insignis]